MTEVQLLGHSLLRFWAVSVNYKKLIFTWLGKCCQNAIPWFKSHTGYVGKECIDDKINEITKWKDGL